jgi:hypothetical protein
MQRCTSAYTAERGTAELKVPASSEHLKLENSHGIAAMDQSERNHSNQTESPYIK